MRHGAPDVIQRLQQRLVGGDMRPVSETVEKISTTQGLWQ